MLLLDSHRLSGEGVCSEIARMKYEVSYFDVMREETANLWQLTAGAEWERCAVRCYSARILLDTMA